MPRDGGLNVPYRFYEVGVTVTLDDLRAWQVDSAIDAEMHRLLTEGHLEETPDGEAAPAVGDISDILAMWTRAKPDLLVE